MGIRTRLVQVGEHVTAGDTPPLTPAIYETSTFSMPSAAALQAYQAREREGYFYTRYDNPTVVGVEQKIASLDGGEAALLFSSGQAATTHTLLGLLKAGDEVVCSAAIYGGTHHLLTDLLPRLGIDHRFVPVEDLTKADRVIGPRTRLVWFESPINPTLRCVDVRAVAAMCRQAGVLSVADNTFASAINQPVLAYGVDLCMQSATKYLNGHSDVTAGAVSGSKATLAPIAALRRLMGGVLDPIAAYNLGRGMKTLSLRVMQQNATALEVARTLEGDARIRRVYYPGLESHPDHAVARGQMCGFGGMVTLDLEGGEAAAFRFFDRLQLIQRAVSLGGVESLCSLPTLSSHAGLTDEALALAGVSRGMVRLSLGLEEADDILADIRQALG